MRSFTTSFRNSLEDQFSDEFAPIFVTLTGATTIRIVNDVVSYIYGGNTYTGMPFSFEMIGDDTDPPKGQITTQNVDRAIGAFLLGQYTPIEMQILIMAQSDFGPVVKSTAIDVQSTRTAIGTPTVQYSASNLFLRNIVADVTQIQADITSYDPTGEPYPAPRTTQNRAPGLYLT